MNSRETLSLQALAVLSHVAGVDVPEEDKAQVAKALQQQLAALDAIDVYDLSDVDPILLLDMSW